MNTLKVTRVIKIEKGLIDAISGNNFFIYIAYRYENIQPPFTFHSHLDLRVIHLIVYILVFHRFCLDLLRLLQSFFHMDTCKMDCPNLIKE